VVSKRSGGDVWSYPNVHGDVQAVANGVGVKQGSTLLYDPFGSLEVGVVDNQVGSVENSWLGSHQRLNEHAEYLQPMIHMGARPYQPVLGRFLSVDPVEGGNANDYVYPADPINNVDLDGRACVSTLVPGLIIGKGWVHGKCPDWYGTSSQAEKYADLTYATAKEKGLAGTKTFRVPFCDSWNLDAAKWLATPTMSKKLAKKLLKKAPARAIPVVGWALWVHDGACLLQEYNS